MFYAIFERAGFIEFHTASQKSRVQNRTATNQVIPMDHPAAGPIMLEWARQIDTHGLVRVSTQVIEPVRPTSTWAIVRKRAKDLGVDITDQSGAGVWDVMLDAPEGHTFRSTGLHCSLVQHEYSTCGKDLKKSHFWAEVLQEMDAGLDRCVNHTTDSNCIAYDCPGAPS